MDQTVEGPSPMEKEKTIRIEKITNGYLVCESSMDKDDGYKTDRTYFEKLPEPFAGIYKGDNRVERAGKLAEGMKDEGKKGK